MKPGVETVKLSVIRGRIGGMSKVECPYGDCPDAPYECWHWMPEQIQPMSPPEPCEACWYWSGEMKVCDQSCEGHTQKEWKRSMFGPNWQGRQLIHNGGKP